MTKKDLITGDIIVTRAGHLGVVLKEQGHILYQEIGMDDLDDFNEDLTFVDEDYPDGDIMQVFRGNSFIDLNDSIPRWERDGLWNRPTAEEREAEEEKKEQERQKMIEEMRRQANPLQRYSLLYVFLSYL